MSLHLNKNTRRRTCLSKQPNETDLQYKQRVLDPLSSVCVEPNGIMRLFG